MSDTSTTSTERATFERAVRVAPQDITPQASPMQGPAPGGRGPLLKWFVVLFVVFAVLGLYSSCAEARFAPRACRADRSHGGSLRRRDSCHGAKRRLRIWCCPAIFNSYVDSPIYARTNGYLKKWYKDIGSQVNKGDLLADIDTPEVDAELAQAKADLATAQANVKLAGITAQRYQDLLKSDSVSKQDVDNFNGDYAAKQAMVQSAAANLNAWKNWNPSSASTLRFPA